jgi:hypothetical protein
MAKRKKILIAGFEIGGQMKLLSDSFNDEGYLAKSISFNHNAIGYNCDINLGGKWYFGFIFKIFLLIHSLFVYDVFYFFWGKSILSFWRYHHLDLPILKLFNKKIIVHFRGGDILDGKIFYEYLNSGMRISSIENFYSYMRPDQINALEKWKKYADNILVSTPDLLFVDKSAILFPQVIDTNYWMNYQRPKSDKDGIFRVVHVPTAKQKKGTQYVIDTIKQLQDEGYEIELILGENVYFEDIKELYASADIGIDQLIHGWYGKVSVELMSMNKPVICYLDEIFSHIYPKIPIINTNKDDLYKTLKSMLFHKSKIESTESREFALNNHEVKNEIKRLIKECAI